MRVRREGVPDVAFLQRGEAHDQLAALDAALVDVFVNRPLVGGCLGAQRHRRGVLRLHHRGGMRRVRRAAQEIKLRRILGVLALERDRLACPSADKRSPAGRAAKVLPSAWTAPAPPTLMAPSSRRSRKKARPVSRWLGNSTALPAGMMPPTTRRSRSVNRAGQLARREKAGDEKSVAEFLRGHARDILRARHPANGVLEHEGQFKIQVRPLVNCKSVFQLHRLAL